VQKYCPEFPQKEWPITSRELLGHLGGIRHYHPDGKGDVPEDSARHFASMQESLQLFAGDPLVAKPGTKFNYSTYGYTLVGCVLEGAASEEFVDYVRKNIFQPSGMEQTRDDDFFTVIPHRTRWYHKDKSGIVRNAGTLLKPSTRELMWTSLKTAEGKQTGYGLGWGIADKFGLPVLAHTGGQ
jgi:serine beta-lactamase-like protein LACTB, mitochondrial